MEEFGVSEFTTYPWSFDHDVRTYADLGIRRIEVAECKLDPHRMNEQFDSLGGRGLSVCSVQPVIRSIFPDSNAAEPPAPADRVRHIAGSMRRLARFVPPMTPFIVSTGAAAGGNIAEACRTALRWLRDLSKVAESLNLRIALEPLDASLMNVDTAIWSLGDALEMVSAVGSDSCALCVDAWNVWQTPDVENVIAAASGRIAIAQIGDWRRPRLRNDRVSLGDGSIPFSSIFAALRRARYKGPYVLELLSSESLPDSLWRGDLRSTLARNKETFERLMSLARAAA